MVYNKRNMLALYYQLKPKRSRSHHRRYSGLGGEAPTDSDLEDDSVEYESQDVEHREYIWYRAVPDAQSGGWFQYQAQAAEDGGESMISDSSSGSSAQYQYPVPNPFIAYIPNVSAASYSSADYVAQALGSYGLSSIVLEGGVDVTSMEHFDEAGYGGYEDAVGARPGGTWPTTSRKEKEKKRSRDEAGRRSYDGYSFFGHHWQSRHRDGTLRESNDSAYEGASLEEAINRWKEHYGRGV